MDVFKLNSNNLGKHIDFRPTRKQEGELQSDMKKQHIGPSEAVRRRLDKVSILEAENHNKEKQIKESKDYIRYLEGNMSPHMLEKASNEMYQACPYLDCDSKGNILCRNKNPPIKTQDLSAKACMLCQRLMKTKQNEKETKRKEQEEMKKFREETKRTIRKHQERVNETLATQNTQETSKVKPDAGPPIWGHEDYY